MQGELEKFNESNFYSSQHPFNSNSLLISKMQAFGLFDFLKGQNRNDKGQCKYCTIPNPVMKMKYHFYILYCLFVYDCMTQINSEHSRTDFFWLTRSCESLYFSIQENNNRPSCFDFDCIKTLEAEYRDSRPTQQRQLQESNERKLIQTRTEFEALCNQPMLTIQNL